MVSFLNKLKSDGSLVSEEPKAKKKPGEEEAEEKKKKNIEISQIEVDVFQTSKMIVIIAQMPGIDTDDIDISIENENDVVTLQGRKYFPEIEGVNEDKKYLRQECKWGEFYRQIILPQEINLAEVEAKFERGILVIKLPFLRIQDKGKRKVKINQEEDNKE